MLDRRAFLGIFGLLAAPRGAEGQPAAGKVYRLGILSSSPPPPASQRPLFERLRELGWAYGRDFVVEDRVYGDELERVPDLAAELIRAGIDIFVVSGAADAVRVQRVTKTVPIVAWGAGDLVAAGAATSVARPGGNITGIQTLQPELAAKHLSLLREAIPRLSRAGILFQLSPSSKGPSSNDAVRREVEAAGKALGIAPQIVTIDSADQLEGAFSAFLAQRAQAVIIVRNQFMGSHLKTVVNLALKHRLPTISDGGSFAPEGGLISYGFNFRDSMRSAADIVDKILRGGKAAEIPIQQATTFRLVVNLKTAKALGLTISPSVLARADQVIE